MSEQIKLRVIRRNKIFGYERLANGNWEWMCPELNPDNGWERWSKGIIYDSDNRYIRDRFTGRKDEKENEIYEEDIVQDLEGNFYKVEWNDDVLIWQLSDGSPLNGRNKSSNYLTVIGNTYENPNLF